MAVFDWKMIRKGIARVERCVVGYHGFNELVQAMLIVEDTNGEVYSHLMPSAHSLSKALALQSEQRVSERVNGGHFFVANGQLIDYRGVTKNKQFVHTDEAITTMLEEVGVRFLNSVQGEGLPKFTQFGRKALQPDDLPMLNAVTAKTGIREHLLADNISFSSFRDATDLHLPTLGEEGEFMSVVGQVWSPFKPHVEFTMGLVRKASASGMIGTREGLVQRFQIVNDWEHHLDIASQRFRDDVHKHLIKRFAIMQDTRASVELVNRAHEHIVKRTKAMSLRDDAYGRAKNLMAVLDCKFHLGAYYMPHVFQEARMKGALQSHLTLFDLWGCVLDTDAYIPQVKGASTNTLQVFANELVMVAQKLHGVDRIIGHEPETAFGSLDDAFFGRLVS